MRHRVKGRKLSRTASHRSATLRNLATSLLKHKKIKTTSAKAKELRAYIEPMITKAKSDSVAARRHIAKDIHDKDIIKELFTDIVEKIGSRPGGYTRIVKLGNRFGDAAEMSIIELVDFSDLIKEKKTKKAASKSKTKDAEDVEEANVVEESSDSTEKKSAKTKAKKTAKPKVDKKETKKTTKKVSTKKVADKSSTSKKSKRSD